MSASKSVNAQNKEGREKMQSENGKLEKVMDGVGWGLFLILMGALIFSENKGWLNGDGWSYFAIGLGAILVISFLVRYFVGHMKIWKVFGALVAGIALIYIGIAFLNDLGDWWPMALIIIGAGYLVKGLWHRKSEYQIS